MKKIVIGLSGGMDSVTMLGILLEQGYEVHACSFHYGSKHNEFEKEAVKQIIQYYSDMGLTVVPYFMDLSNAFANFESNLLLSGKAIPEGHYEEESMRQTVVPGRNMIFASIMAGLAESIGATEIGIGVHQGDHHIYPDCRREFIKAFDTAVYLSSAGKVCIKTPLIDDNKTSILEKGFRLHINVPYHLTRTCYKHQKASCGKCGSCQERLEAFQNLNLIDPIDYE